MTFTDRTMVCQDCGAEFVFTVGEQEFYSEKGFKNEPKRCNDCRKSRKAERRSARPKKTFTVVCEACGVETQVPFEPKDGRPVYCRACFDNQRSK